MGSDVGTDTKKKEHIIIRIMREDANRPKAGIFTYHLPAFGCIYILSATEIIIKSSRLTLEASLI